MNSRAEIRVDIDSKWEQLHNYFEDFIWMAYSVWGSLVKNCVGFYVEFNWIGTLHTTSAIVWKKKLPQVSTD